MQIGHRGQSKGNTDTENVHQPADTFVDARANELYVADGYGDQRIVVFDTNTGKFKRMWGAFGNAPTAEMKPNPPVPQPQEPGTEGPQQFGLPHAVKVSNDGTVYVADRINNRIQLFTTAGKYLRTVRVTNDGRRRGAGSRRLLVLAGQDSSSISTSSIPGRCASSSSIGRR